MSSGTEVVSPHGIPTDLIDRLLVIRTIPYKTEEILHILSIRAKTEGLNIADEALAFLAQIGSETSLRYAVQLLTPSNILAGVNGRETIAREDIEEASSLFFDAKASAKMLQEHGDKYISN